MTRSRSTDSLEAMYARDTASRTMGIAVEVPTDGEAVATLSVTATMLNGFDVCHGGYIFALADTAFAFACNGGDAVTVAAGASIDFLCAVREGDTLTARASERRRGRRSGIYDVDVTNQEDRLVALFRGRAYATSRSHGEPDAG